MLFHNPELFQQVLEAKRGKKVLPQPLEALRLWLSEAYGIDVLHVMADHLDIGPSQGQSRLSFFVNTVADRDKLMADRSTILPGVKRKILTRAGQLAQQNPIAGFDFKAPLITIDVFASESIRRTISEVLEKHRNSLLAHFASDNVKILDGTIGTVAVFFATETQRQQSETSGLRDQIVDHFLSLARRYDEFHYLTRDSLPVIFDSIENLNKNYAGSLFYYWR